MLMTIHLKAVTLKGSTVSPTMTKLSDAYLITFPASIVFSTHLSAQIHQIVMPLINGWINIAEVKKSLAVA